MYVFKSNKKSLSAFDDKIYILEDGINTIPHCSDKEKIINLQKHLHLFSK